MTAVLIPDGMALHLIKLCVGAASIEDLESWQAANRQMKDKATGRPCVYHTTFQTPKRQSEVLAGGSLYWVVKGLIAVRQRLVRFSDGQKDDGSPCCLLILDPSLVPARPTPRRAFQGWRYLAADDAPADLSGGAREIDAMPAHLRRDLAALGLL